MYVFILSFLQYTILLLMSGFILFRRKFSVLNGVTCIVIAFLFGYLVEYTSLSIYSFVGWAILPLINLHKYSRHDFLKIAFMNILIILTVLLMEIVFSILIANLLPFYSTIKKESIIFYLIWLSNTLLNAGGLFLLRNTYDKLYNFLRERKIFVQITSFFLLVTIAMYLTIMSIDNMYNIPFVLTNVFAVFLLIYFISICGIIFILIWTLQKKHAAKLEQQSNIQLRQYTENLEVFYNDIRRFRHDYINLLAPMAGFFDEQNYQGLEEYFYSHIQKLEATFTAKDLVFRGLIHMKVREVKGILSMKLLKAQEYPCEIKLEIAEDINDINMNIVDFCRCLGIIIDNALEAIVHKDDGAVNIAFIKKENSLFVIVMNTFYGEFIPIFKLFEQGFSTKGKNRGEGLSSLRQIIESYQNVTLDTRIENGAFIQEILIEQEG